jgi:hypothetical protein
MIQLTLSVADASDARRATCLLVCLDDDAVQPGIPGRRLELRWHSVEKPGERGFSFHPDD